MKNPILYELSESEKEKSNMFSFMRFIEGQKGEKFSSYEDFHNFSLKREEDFWKCFLDFFSLKFEGSFHPFKTHDSFTPYPFFPASIFITAISSFFPLRV